MSLWAYHLNQPLFLVDFIILQLNDTLVAPKSANRNRACVRPQLYIPMQVW